MIQRMIRIHRAPLGVVVATVIIGVGIYAFAQEPITFKLTGVRAGAAAEFQAELQRARVKVSEWWGATFDGTIVVEIDTQRALSMALVPAWRGERGQMTFGFKRVQAAKRRRCTR